MFEHFENPASLVCSAEALGLAPVAELLSEHLQQEEHTSKELHDRLRQFAAI